MSTNKKNKSSPKPEAENEEKTEIEAEEVLVDEAAETQAAEETEAAPDNAAVSDEYAALTDKYLRICAEYDNFRRRSQKEKEGIYGDVKADTVSKFLPVYDNLERALAHTTEDEAYRKGVEMIMKQFEATLEKLGVVCIESLGAKFDPELHNAVMQVQDEEKGEGEIVEVFQQGFKHGEKVIRFAMVKVAN